MVRQVIDSSFSDERLLVIGRIAQTLLELAVDIDRVGTAEADDLLDQFKSVANLIINDLNLMITRVDGPEFECRVIPRMP